MVRVQQRPNRRVGWKEPIEGDTYSPALTKPNPNSLRQNETTGSVFCRILPAESQSSFPQMVRAFITAMPITSFQSPILTDRFSRYPSRKSEKTLRALTYYSTSLRLLLISYSLKDRVDIRESFNIIIFVYKGLLI